MPDSNLGTLHIIIHLIPLNGPILQRRKLRHREAMELALDLTTSKYKADASSQKSGSKVYARPQLSTASLGSASHMEPCRLCALLFPPPHTLCPPIWSILY